MAIFIRGVEVRKVITGSANGTINGAVHASTQIGDHLIAFAASNDQTNSSISATDWQLFSNNYSVAGSTAAHVGFLRRVYSGTENLIFNIGADTRDDYLVIISLYGNIDATTPIGAISTYSSGSSSTNFTAGTVTSTIPESLLLSFCAAKSGASALANDTGAPTGMTILFNQRSQALSAGIRAAVAYEQLPVAGATGTRTWSPGTAFLSSANYGVAVNIVINGAPGTSITGVNGGTGVRANSTGNVATSTGAWAGSVNAGTLGGKALTITGFDEVTGDITFIMPAYADGATYPRPNGTHTAQFTNGTYSPTLAGVQLNQPTGRTAVTVASPDNTDPKKLGYWFALDGKTPVNGDVIIGVDADVTWNADTGGAAAGPLPKTTEVVFWQQSSGITYFYNVTVQGAEIVVPPVAVGPLGRARSLLRVSGSVLAIDGTTHPNGQPVSLSPYGGLQSGLNGRWVAQTVSASAGSVVIDGVTVTPPAVLYMSPAGKLTTTPNGQPVAVVRS